METSNRLQPEERRPQMLCIKCLAVLNVPEGCTSRNVMCPKCGTKQKTDDGAGRN